MSDDEQRALQALLEAAKRDRESDLADDESEE
jgi:hypothetical protein